MADAGRRKRARYEKARRLEAKQEDPKRRGGDSAEPPPAAAVRLFVALDLPGEITGGLAEWQRRALADDALRPMREEALHVTLCFLGHHPERAVGRIVELVRAIEPAPVAMRLEAAPVPIPGGRPRLYAVEAESPDAVALQARVAQPLVAEGFFEPEKREFWPHVTVARVRSERLPPEQGARRGRSRPKRVGKPPSDLPKTLLDPFGCVRVALYRSILKPGGAEYAARGRRLAVLAGGTEEVMKKMADETQPLRPADAKETKAKDAALTAALSQIDKQFGQGSVMKLGEKATVPVEIVPTGALALDIALGGAGFRAGGSSRSSAPSRRARPRSSTTSSPRLRRAEASAPSSTPSTPSTRSTLARSASTPTSCSSRSPTTASRRSRSSTCSSARVPSTSSRSTRSRR